MPTPVGPRPPVGSAVHNVILCRSGELSALLNMCSMTCGHVVQQAVIAHELGHLKCNHGVWLTMANVLATNTLSVLPLLSGAVEEGLLRWLRAAELTCDRAALLVAQDHRVVISALMKLAGGSPKLNAELNVEAFLRQVGFVHTCRVNDGESL